MNNNKLQSAKSAQKITLGFTKMQSNNIQKALVPPVLHEVSKLAAGVASVSASSIGGVGSATGKSVIFIN